MKVSQAIEILTAYYKPEDEILIEWWDKDWAESILDKDLDDMLWSDMVAELSELDLSEDTTQALIRHAKEN